MKRKIRLSALLAVSVLMLALLIGGLYGYFDDTETSTGNVFTAGTLDLQTWVDGASPTGASFVVTQSDNVAGLAGHVVFSNVSPGDNGTMTWVLTNGGTIDGTLGLAGTVTFDENGIWEPESAALGESSDPLDGGELDTNMFCILYQDSVAQTSLIPFANLQAALSDSMLLSAGADTTYELYWEIAPTVGNVIQSDQATIDITFTLNQIP
jgi:spore coat-associated protein N